MKALRKNIYAFTVIVLFVIAFGMLILFLALFSSSTAVDSTTVGSVYIGDEKPNTDARKKKLTNGVNNWKDDAIYTISFQNVSLRIGDTPRIDPETGAIVTELYDKVSKNLVRKDTNEETGEEIYIKLDENGKDIIDEKTNKPVLVAKENVKESIVYDHNGLTILDFDYKRTNDAVNANTTDKSNNLAYFTMTEENKQALYDQLVEKYGTKVTDDSILDYTQLLNDIIADAEQMKNKVDYDLFDYATGGDWQNTEIDQIEIENLSVKKVEDLASKFEGVTIEIKPQKTSEGKLGFSTIEFLSQPEYSTLSSSDMSIIATGLAAVVQKTSLTVTVKNQGYISDRYYAYDDMTARVNIKDDTDLRIINPETHSYYITIFSGNSKVNNTLCLKFKLEGCKFINEYKVEKVAETIEHHMVYDAAATLFNYDEENPNMGYDKDFEGGVYYNIYQEGRDTYLYSYVKTIKYVNGEEETVEVYPKQEFFVGQDELRHWTKKGLN
ncbi:MAG: hypothetical protein J6Y28_09105 [Acholeplasmatales bacterium]|nr:hypothetical protein [Acholeplasmatales bacterium]